MSKAYTFKKRIFMKKANLPVYQRGMSVVEVLIVVALIAVMALAFFPNIRNTMETRDFENAARDIQTTIQRARMEAVKTKLNHRVKFVEGTGGWEFSIEKEETSGTWILMPGFVKKIIPSRFNVTVNFPGEIVVFSPLGFIQNYSSAQNSITIQSPKLDSENQPDQRTVFVFAGGSTRYLSSESG
jgi:prepilin-type N-terminal cleavage/methylation domain-containing protein